MLLVEVAAVGQGSHLDTVEMEEAAAALLMV
jgi:hypothetical protein